MLFNGSHATAPPNSYTPGNKRVSGYRFRYQLTCPLYTGVFLGNALQLFFLHIDPKTADMSQFLQLGPLDFDPDLGYVSYFWGIDSANNHSHISKSHPLNNTDTLGGRFPWPVTLSKCNWFLEHTPNLHI